MAPNPGTLLRPAPVHRTALPLTKRIELIVPLLLCAATLFCAAPARRRWFLAVGLFVMAWVATTQRIQWSSIPEQGVRGIAQVEIESVQHRRSAFGTGWFYKGTLTGFWKHQPEGWEPSPLHHLPCSFLISEAGPIRDSSCLLEARLCPGVYPGVQLKQMSGHESQPGWSLAQWRASTKAQVRRWLQTHIPDRSASSFLCGIATGELDDPLLLTELSRFGLQHLLAISGLHFALLASVLAFALRSCLGDRTMAPILVGLLFCYALFIGDSPSVARACLSAAALWFSLLAQRPSSALNNLGIALGALVLYKPLWVLHLGFQLSFLATAAILVLVAPLDQWLQRLIPPRPFTFASSMPLLDKHGYLLLHLTRKALSLTLAVHLAVCPLIASILHQFNPLSLVYNLFFPALIAPSLALLVVAAPFALIFPPLSHFLCLLNSSYTAAILSLVECTPTAIDLNISWALPSWACLAWLILLFGWGLAKRSQSEGTQPHWLV